MYFIILLSRTAVVIFADAYRVAVSVFERYSRMPGSCMGGDIKGARLSLVSCVHACDALRKCVGFVFASSQRKTCWLKRRLCKRTKKVRDAMVYVRGKSPRAPHGTRTPPRKSRHRAWWPVFVVSVVVLVIVINILFRVTRCCCLRVCRSSSPAGAYAAVEFHRWVEDKMSRSKDTCQGQGSSKS